MWLDQKKVFSDTKGKEEGEASQRRAITLLKNDNKQLPLKAGSLKIYVENIDKKVAAQYATVVDKPQDADLAIIRLNTPWYPVETNNFMARMFHHGDLDFKGTKKDSILQLLNASTNHCRYIFRQAGRDSRDQCQSKRFAC
jgi:beta-glucosidase